MGGLSESLGVRITYHHIFTCTHSPEITGTNVICLSCFHCLYIFSVVLELKTSAPQWWKRDSSPQNVLLTAVSMVVKFSNPHNRSAVSQRKRIPPCASTVEAYGGHVLKHEENNSIKAQNIFILLVSCHLSVLETTVVSSKWVDYPFNQIIHRIMPVKCFCSILIIN